MSSRSSAIQIFQPLFLASAASSQLDEAQKETDIEMEGNNFSRAAAAAAAAWWCMDRILMNSNNVNIKICNALLGSIVSVKN